MSRKDLENVIRQRLYNAAPGMTTWIAGQVIKSEPLQKWADRVERERPRGIVAWWRRKFGREGLTPEQQQKLEELVQKAAERFGR